ncbi:hypothetical protein ZOSMA_81G00130 [Zostera marina]|uniref:Uncharacterized protein n=1 Tax=Zostera marina TaxID=29655 RepID=A0A0K9NM05_ZOSMR|nr:hypothetical protein ZOSMA_81G00130 [Zostera marina]
MKMAAAASEAAAASDSGIEPAAASDSGIEPAATSDSGIEPSAAQTRVLKDLFKEDGMVIPLEWKETTKNGVVKENQNEVRLFRQKKGKAKNQQDLRLMVISRNLTAICSMLRCKTKKEKTKEKARITEVRRIMAVNVVEREEDSISSAVSFCKRSFL